MLFCPRRFAISMSISSLSSLQFMLVSKSLARSLYADVPSSLNPIGSIVKICVKIPTKYAWVKGVSFSGFKWSVSHMISNWRLRKIACEVNKTKQVMFVKHYVHGCYKVWKPIVAYRSGSRSQSHCQLLHLRGQWNMHVKKEVSISYGSNVMTKINIDNRQRNKRQYKNNMLPIFRFGA